MQSFAELFGLRDPARTSFELNPERDAALLVDIDQNVPSVERWFIGGEVPRAALYGDFGTGKTHLLHYVERVLAPRLRYRPVFVELTGFGKRSTFHDMHLRVMSKLLGVYEEQRSRLDQRQVASAVAALGSDSDIAQAFSMLRDPDLDSERRALYRAWLLGAGPTPTQARREGLKGRLLDWASAKDLVQLWQLVGTFQIFSDNRRLLLLIDEGEALQRVVHPDSLVAIGAGLRSLFDATNTSLGCIMALNQPDIRRNRDHPFLRSDIVSRLQGKMQKLEPLNTDERIQHFTQALWEMLSPARTPLFEEAALKALTPSNLVRMRTIITLGQIAPTVTPTQRDLVQILIVIGSIALQYQVPPPLRLEHLRSWIPGGVQGP